MEEIIENEVRERVCEENRQRMFAVKRNFTLTRIYNVYLGIPMVLVSWILLIGWMAQTSTGIRKAITMMAEEPEPVYFPWYAVTAFLVPFIALLSLLADYNPRRLYSLLAFLLHFVILLFSAANMVMGFEPMIISHMIFLAVYGLLGMWSEDFALRSYKELDYLVTQEGYPDFNFNLEAGRYSRYVKYRTGWLKKQKNLDYFTPSEKPMQAAVIEKAESGSKMEGIALSDSDKSEWLSRAENSEPPPVKYVSINCGQPEKMTELQTEEIDLDYVDEYDDPRRRPL